MIPGKRYDPGTRTSRRPTPEKFAHLRKWAQPIDRFITLTSITEITNINEQLEQSATLYINNIIQRVIAQIIGEYGDGFVTIKSTADGALHIYPAGGTTDGVMDVALGASTEEIGKVEIIAGTAEIGKLAAGVASIGKVLVEGPGQAMLYKPISTAAPGPTALIGAATDLRHHITMIVLTVAGATGITFSTAGTPMTGAMAFGGTDEPRGMVANHGNFPLVGGTNEAFNITNSGSILITGYLVYYNAV